MDLFTEVSERMKLIDVGGHGPGFLLDNPPFESVWEERLQDWAPTAPVEREWTRWTASGGVLRIWKMASSVPWGRELLQFHELVYGLEATNSMFFDEIATSESLDVVMTGDPHNVTYEFIGLVNDGARHWRIAWIEEYEHMDRQIATGGAPEDFDLDQPFQLLVEVLKKASDVVPQRRRLSRLRDHLW